MVYLYIQMVKVVASGGEVKEAAIGHQRTSLDLQLLDQDYQTNLGGSNLGGLTKANLEDQILEV